MTIGIFAMYVYIMVLSYYVSRIILVSLGFVKKDAIINRLLVFFEDLTIKTSTIIDAVISTFMISLWFIILEESNTVRNNNILFIWLFIISILLTLGRAIKQKQYKNREYNRIVDSISKVTLLMDMLTDGMKMLKKQSVDTENKIKTLKSMINILETIKSELIYNQSVFDLYKVVDVTKQVNSIKADNIRELIHEIDKMNSFNELSRSELDKMYKTLQTLTVEAF